MNRSARAAGLATAAVWLLVATATPVTAQNEQSLKAYFEGRPITLRLDMPGSTEGVDIRVDQPQTLDYKKYRDNLKRHGIAIPYGDSSRITLIKLKKDLLEFQIGGGPRLNLRWSSRVPADITREEIENALIKYVDFGNSRDFPDSRAATIDLGAVQKGMQKEEVEAAFGVPVQRSEQREAGIVVTTLIFDVGDERLTAAFVENILVRYTIGSR